MDASAVHDPNSIEPALVALAFGGVAVWVGGVRADISVPYTRMVTQEQSIVGSYMYGPESPTILVNLIETGVLNLSRFRVRKFGLEDINEAISQESNSKGLSAAVVQP